MSVRIEEVYSLQLRSLDDVKGIAVESKDRIGELYGELIEEVEGDPNLDDFNSTSKTSRWKLWVFLFCFMAWLHEFLWVQFKAVLDNAATYAQSHTVAWYIQKTLEYQHGDSLTVVNGAVTYDPINEDNRIIAAANVKKTSTGGLILKVAKADQSGDLIPLDTAELDGVKGYVDGFQDAGVDISVISQSADVLRLEATVYYLPAQQVLTDFKPAFENAVKTYLRNIIFDGKFRRISMIDEFQKLPAFVDIDIAVLAASIAYSVTSNFVDIDLDYDMIAGYMNVDSNYELDDTITYIPFQQ